jgi:hypothetical protein
MRRGIAPRINGHPKIIAVQKSVWRKCGPLLGLISSKPLVDQEATRLIAKLGADDNLVRLTSRTLRENCLRIIFRSLELRSRKVARWPVDTGLSWDHHSFAAKGPSA